MAKLRRMAALQGHIKAQTRLGIAYSLGEGVRKSDEEAKDWLTRAAGKGDADAQFNLCVLYFYGHVIPQSLKTAVEWFKLSANQGLPEAQEFLEKTEKFILLEDKRSQLLKESLQTSDIEEKKQIWAEIKEIDREKDRLKGIEPEEEPKDNLQNNSSNSKGSGSGCMILLH